MKCPRSILVFVLAALAGRAHSAQASALHAMARGESVDAISGLHWLTTVDPAHPGAPPRLSLIGDATRTTRAKEPPLHAQECVRAGNRILLREVNAKVSMLSLDAVALESGACGARIRARVSATGGVVEMTVLDAQTGALAAKAGAWR